ncbi:MAG: helix-turn-helix domain-containing protein [Zoogloeaceae bacterium]|nr:helix-turn-helix domain-containing protein [Zoogloeaceae bacterium]
MGCADGYGITPATGYKWLRRFREEGVSGLEAHSRRPLYSPKAMSRQRRYMPSCATAWSACRTTGCPQRHRTF